MRELFLFYFKCFQNVSVKIFVSKDPVLKNKISVSTAFFRNGNRTGIQVKNAVFPDKFRNVGVSRKDDAFAFDGWEGFVAVNREHFETVDAQENLFVEHRKFQNHLVHLGVTVAANANNILFYAVEHRNYLFWRITFGKVVARAVVKNVAEQQKPFGVLTFKSFEHLLTEERASVDIRSYHKFHKTFPPSHFVPAAADNFCCCLCGSKLHHVFFKGGNVFSAKTYRY